MSGERTGKGGSGGDRGSVASISGSRRSASPQRGSSVQPSVTSASHACSFCKRRKIRCDGDIKHPCTNCERRNQLCEDARPNVARPRPTRDALQSLEREKEQLLAFVQRLRLAHPAERDAMLEEWQDTPSHSGPPQSDDPGDSIRQVDADTLDADSHGDSPLAIQATRHLHVQLKDGQTAFHGHTSIFDSHTAQHDAPHLRLHPAFTSDEDARHATHTLNEAAARGRHTEILNLAAGRLDFDGLDPEIAMELLYIHWHRQHHALLLTHRPSFMRDMAVQGGGKYFSKLLLNAIYFGASKFSTRMELRSDPADPRTAGFRFLKRINELMGEAITRSRIPTIQALLLLASSLFALGQHESSWLYSGLAFRMIVDLGLHIDNTAFNADMSPEDVEIRRRLLYGAFCFDKIHSLYQGRQPTLSQLDIKVPLIFNDTYEEQELWRPNSHFADGGAFGSGVPTLSVSTFTAMCKLCFILERALNDLYSFASFGHSMQRRLANLKSLDSSLTQFANDLPPHLRVEASSTSPTPYPSNLLALHMVWQTLVILVHRPFVAQGHLSSNGDVSEASWQKCLEAADRTSDILKIYKKMLGLTRAPFLISYCAYIAATIHVRVLAQAGSNSLAKHNLRFCMEVFAETETINTGVSKAKEVLLSLMAKLHVSLDTTTSESEATPEQASMNIPGLPMDMDALFRSFAPDGAHIQGGPALAYGQGGWNEMARSSNDPYADVLYGLMSGGNVSGYDILFNSSTV